jgi:hypothetical protein
MLYEDCVVTGFELRIAREQAVKLKLDIRGKRAPAIWPWQDMASAEAGERFMGDRVSYRVNGGEYANIYGFTMTARKEDGTRTEVWIHRALEPGADFPAVIDTMSVTALLLRDKYELRHYGMFRLTLSRLLLMADETAVDCGDSVIGPLRYYVAGKVKAEVFTNSGETLE